jgi:hypothetical protein
MSSAITTTMLGRRRGRCPVGSVAGVSIAGTAAGEEGDVAGEAGPAGDSGGLTVGVATPRDAVATARGGRVAIQVAAQVAATTTRATAA